MITKINKTLLLVISFVVMIGCHEIDSSGISPASHSRNYQFRAGVTCNEISEHNYNFVWNANNLYDSIGFLHNEALDYYIINNNYPWDSTSSLNENIIHFYNVVSPYFASQGMSQGLNFYANYIDSLFVYFPANTASFSEYLLLKGYSNKVVEKIDQLFSITFEQQNAIELCKKIKNMENSVITSSLPDNEKQLFLIGSSVVKFSATYWYEVENDTSNGWHNNGEPLSKVGPLTRALVDAIGAIGSLSFSGGASATSAFVMTDSIINAVYKWLKGLPQSAQDLTNFP